MTVRARVLVAEDNDALRRGIALALSLRQHSVDEARTGSEAIQRIEGARGLPYDVILTDLRLPGADGLAVLRAAREQAPRTRVLVMTAYATVEGAVQAMRLGAADFVQKPIALEQLEERVERCSVELRSPAPPARETPAGPEPAPVIVGTSPALHAAMDLARRVAPTRSTVLITGETGTGKELLAGLVHGASPRSQGPFVKVNCAALPETLLESELFGHERGAFTGADRQRLGRFEQASGGTLFLDEVGDTSPATQAKLLRVLQDQEFHRLGGTRILRTDARIVAATNQDLPAEVRAGRFREDLYFRLDVIRIHLPPLRERPEDILALAHHFLARLSAELERPLRGFSDAALACLERRRWPGNVRELLNAVERAVLLAPGPLVDEGDLVLPAGEAREEVWRPEIPPGGISLFQAERQLLLAALERSRFVQKDAAALLGVSRRKLNYMIGKYGIRHPAWRRHRGPAPDGGGAGERGDPFRDP